MNRKLILIGGAPTIGKSYTAEKIAKELKLPWESTDDIREEMRKSVKKEDYPGLFQHSDSSAERAVEFLTHNTAEEIVKHQNDESKDVWKGVKDLIEKKYIGQSFIIEGIAILPELVAELLKEKPELKTVFLIDEDEERIRKTVFTRGLWDDADKYPDEVKEKEVKWVIAFNNYIKKETKKYNFPIVEIGDRESYLNKIKELVK